MNPPNSQALLAWPAKPLRLEVPFATGDSSEVVARAVAGELAKTIGQSVFVDKKPGAAGNIAMQEVAHSTDEHTLILGHIGTLAVNPSIFAKLPYDANRDFAPITLVAKVPSLYVVHPDLPVNNLTGYFGGCACTAGLHQGGQVALHGDRQFSALAPVARCAHRGTTGQHGRRV